MEDRYLIFIFGRFLMNRNEGKYLVGNSELWSCKCCWN